MKYKHNWISIPLPSWVMWIARNKDGLTYGYNIKPTKTFYGWSVDDPLGRQIFICVGDKLNWEDSLEERPAEFLLGEYMEINSLSMNNLTGFISKEVKKKLLGIGYPAHMLDDILKEQVFRFFRYHDFCHKIEKIYLVGEVGYQYSIDLGVDWRLYEGANAKAYCVKSDEFFKTYEEAEDACIERLIKIYETKTII